MTLVADIGNKQQGYLIKSDDWNELVAAVDQLRADLTSNVNTLNTKIDTCKSDLEQEFGAADTALDNKLTGSLNTLSGKIDDLKGQFYRLTLQTVDSQYVWGEVAEITAQVTTVDGQALPAGARPWLHFIANWGTLKAADGFDSRSGIGNRTLAVRTDATGLARVLLGGEQAVPQTTEDEKALDVTLGLTVPAANLTCKQVIKQSSSALDAKNKGAFQLLNGAYDSNPQFRHVADGYYLHQIGQGMVVPQNEGEFVDYRAMVIAFVTADSDPLTPDWGRGASALLVTFRDWIWSWVGLGYLVVEAPEVGTLHGVIESRLTQDRGQSYIQIENAITSAAVDKGALGAHKVYQTAQSALDLLNPPNPPPFLNELRSQMQNVVAFQQAVGGTAPEVVLKTLTGVTSTADGQFVDVQSQVSGFQQTVQALQAQLDSAKKDLADARDQMRSDMDAKIQDFDSRVADAQASFGGQVTTAKQEIGAQVQDIAQKVDQVSGKVDTVMNEHVVDLVKQVGVLQGQYDKALGDGGDVLTLKADVKTLQDKYGVFEQQGVAPATIANRFLDIDQQQQDLQVLKTTVQALQNK